MENIVNRRIQAVDALRGLVMIVMALDHVRDFVHNDVKLFRPDDLARASTALFFTRWVTHFCAPVFFFTAGVGAWFYLRNGRTPGELSRFLWTRGAWLILLEVTVLRFGYGFSMTEGVLLLTVLWGLGWSMIALGFLSRMPVRALAILSLAAIALHNLADPITARSLGPAAWLWTILHQPGAIVLGPVVAAVGYSFVPWMFVMSAGFCFGSILEREPAVRQRWMLWIGSSLTAAFVVIRALNIYGDPSPWTGGLLSFLRCTKYPPSLDFLLMTLGPALLFLTWLDQIKIAKTNPAIVFGRTPLFYFIGHFYVAHLVAVALAASRYSDIGFMFHPLPWIGGVNATVPADYGYPLPIVYVCWIVVVAVMYPACLWFARVKERNRSWWLSYL